VGTSIEAFFNQPRQKHYTIHYYVKNRPKLYRELFKFAFVRNPWTKVVNHYRWRQERKYRSWNLDGPLGVPFPVWLDDFYKTFKRNKGKTDIYPTHLASHLNPYGTNLIPQVNWISNQDGKLLVDFVGRFERLQQDFNTVCSRLKLKRTKLPWLNQTRHKPYHEYYNKERINMVADIYAKDIEYFDFHFNKGITLL
jgi:hypothetical protein